MVVRVWGEVNGEEIEFHPIPDRPYYWEGFAPKSVNVQDLNIWALTDRGALGHLKTQVKIEYHTKTEVRLLITPFLIELLKSYRVQLLTSPIRKEGENDRVY